MAWIVFLMLFCLTNVIAQDSKDIGVNYGFNGDNLPNPNDVVKAYKQYGIGKMRIFEPNVPMLDALQGQGIDLVLGVRNEDLPNLASCQDAAEQWFVANVQPYVDSIVIPFITMGNELVPKQFSDSILPAMQNLQNVLFNHGLQAIRTTTVVDMGILQGTYPPSAATFTEASQPIIIPILQQLQTTGTPILINIYPYFIYSSNPTDVRKDYALFTATGAPVVTDGDLNYMNLFDAMVDSLFWAMEKNGITNVGIGVTESGWPHEGNGEFTSVDLAKTYNKNFMDHILSRVGTPKRPGAYIEGFIFAMVDEDLKEGATEQNFGMFKPSLEPNYNIFS